MSPHEQKPSLPNIQLMKQIKFQRDCSEKNMKQWSRSKVTATFIRLALHTNCCGRLSWIFISSQNLHTYMHYTNTYLNRFLPNSTTGRHNSASKNLALHMKLISHWQKQPSKQWNANITPINYTTWLNFVLCTNFVFWMSVFFGTVLQFHTLYFAV